MSNLAIKEREGKNKLLVFEAQKQFEASNEFKMNFMREAGFAIQILTGNEYLASANPTTIKHAVANIANIGLTLNPALKLAYLIPRKVKDQLHCILDISYMGLIKIITDMGAVKGIHADVICENDKYDYRKGSDPYLKHTPNIKGRGKIIGVYAIAYYRDGGSIFEILNREEVEKIRATSESYKNEKGRKYSPWVTWEDEMYKKSAIKRLWKLLPKTNFSDQLIAALSTEHENEVSDLSKEDKYQEIFNEVQEAEEVKDIPTENVKPDEQKKEDIKKPGTALQGTLIPDADNK